RTVVSPHPGPTAIEIRRHGFFLILIVILRLISENHNAGALTVLGFQLKVRENYRAITGSTNQPRRPHDESNFSSSLAEGDGDASSGRLYAHRTSRDNRNHRDSGGIALDGDYESPGQSARDRLSWQRQAALACLAFVRCGQ